MFKSVLSLQSEDIILIKDMEDAIYLFTNMVYISIEFYILLMAFQLYFIHRGKSFFIYVYVYIRMDLLSSFNFFTVLFKQ